MSKKWSDEEYEFLKANYGTMTIKDIAKHLNRSESGVFNKSHLLKLVDSKLFLSREELYTQYIINKKSALNIASTYSVHYSKIYWLLKKYSIDRRTAKESQSNIDRNLSKNRMKTYEGIPLEYHSSLKRVAKKRNLEFSITIEYLFNADLECNMKNATDQTS